MDCLRARDCLPHIGRRLLTFFVPARAAGRLGACFRQPGPLSQSTAYSDGLHTQDNKCWPDDVDPDDFDECDEYYCGNDPYWRYSAGDKGLLGCDDIAAEPEKIEKRCRTQERIGVDATGREVRASIACKGVCRESCEGC